MSKPFEQDQLAAILERWLPVNGSAPATPVPPPPLAIPPAPPAPMDATASGEEPAARPAPVLAPAISPLDESALNQIRALRQPGAPDQSLKLATILDQGGGVSK